MCTLLKQDDVFKKREISLPAVNGLTDFLQLKISCLLILEKNVWSPQYSILEEKLNL